MMRRLTLFAAAALVPAWLLAADFWEEKPFREWGKKDVQKMLSDSPWARVQQFAGQSADRSAGNAGEREIVNSFQVRFLTSLPIRQGMVRFQQLGRNYDEMNEQEQAALDQQFAGLLNARFEAQVIVEMQFTSNDRSAAMDVFRDLSTKTVDTIKQDVFLVTDKHGRVALTGYQPNQTGQVRFVFPRTIDGQPIVGADDKDLAFQFNLEDVADVNIRFKPSDMVFNAKLEI